MIYVFRGRLGVSLWLGVVIALILTIGLVVVGQCADEPSTPAAQGTDLAEMSIEDLMNLTVVTSGKKAETISQTAAAVFVITSDDIERFGYQTLAQAVRRISGFYTETDRYIDAIGARGYLPNGDLNRRVLVLVDGHKVNDALYGQAPVDEDLPVDLRDLDRIEVVKGPGSALWGSEALLCVINCITKKASDIEGLQVSEGLGFRQGPYLAYGKTSSSGLEITGSATRLVSDGERSVYLGDFDTPENNNGVAVGLDGEDVGRGWLNLAFKGLNLRYDHVSRVKEVPTAHWASVFNTPGIDVNDERRYAELSYENPTPYAKDGKLFLRVYQDRYDALMNWNEYLDEETSDELVYSRGIDWAKSWGAEARYSLSISPSVSATMGVEYLTAETQRIIFDVDNPGVLTTDQPGEYSLNSYFVQADWNVSPVLRFVTGTRLDNHSIFGSNWSPRAGLVYNRSPKTTLKLLYGKAFRSPSMAETRTLDNPNGLYPESINTVEFVWDQQLGERGRVVTSLFGYDMYNIIRKSLNRDQVRCRGVETQYDYRLSNGSIGYFGLSYLKARSFNPNRPLTSSPQYVLTWGMSVPVLGNKAYLSPDVQIVSSTRTNMHDTADAHLVANLALYSSSLMKNADLSLSITNLFNTTYYANAQPQDVSDLMPQGGRTLQFLVSRHF